MSKRLFSIVFLLVFSPIGSCSYAAQSSQARVYVKGGVAKPSKNGFTIVAKGWTIHTKALRHDKTGMYVFADDMYPKWWDENKLYRCRECGKYFFKREFADHVAEYGQDHRFFYPVDTDD